VCCIFKDMLSADLPSVVMLTVVEPSKQNLNKNQSLNFVFEQLYRIESTLYLLIGDFKSR